MSIPGITAVVVVVVAHGRQVVGRAVAGYGGLSACRPIVHPCPGSW